MNIRLKIYAGVVIGGTTLTTWLLTRYGGGGSFTPGAVLVIAFLWGLLGIPVFYIKRKGSDQGNDRNNGGNS